MRDYQELSCIASAGYDDLDHTLSIDGLRQKEQAFLPVIAIYGANAAGKSNLLNAIGFFHWAVARSSDAFIAIFDGIKSSNSDLLLIYSNTGMIDIDELMTLAASSLGSGYKVWSSEMVHMHMTMGRKEDRSRNVLESLIIAKKLLFILN
jgi:hypothetical protein